MPILAKPGKDDYSEVEAAQMLGITLDRLHSLLDEHVFNDGGNRPPQVTFRSSDLILLEFWLRSQPQENVVRMPRRL